MRAIKLNAQVTSDHVLHLRLPEDVEEGPAEVIVLVDAVRGTGTDERSGNLADFLSAPRVDARFIRSKSAIDRDLQAERDSWE